MTEVMTAGVGNKDVRAVFPYLARNVLYGKQKPFATDFIPSISDVPLTNHHFDFMDVVVTDARPSRESFVLEEHGFCFPKSNTTLTCVSADDPKYVEEQYYPEIEEALLLEFPEYIRVECLDHQVRKRSHLFPENPGAIVTSAQPAVLPHTDFSAHGCFMGMHGFFPGQEAFYKERDFDILNVWRVLRGPNNDWPLAVCDHRTIDHPHDVIANDVLHEDSVGENWLLHKSSRHSWYYLSDQCIEDLIVFRNTDSKGLRPRAFHAAFDSGVAETQPRQSIEVRVAAFR